MEGPDLTNHNFEASLEYRLAMERRMTTIEQQMLGGLQRFADSIDKIASSIEVLTHRVESSESWHASHEVKHALTQGEEQGRFSVQAEFSKRTWATISLIAAMPAAVLAIFDILAVTK